MTALRFWLGFTILAAWVFGLLGVAAYFLVTWHPGATLAVILLVWVSAKVLPRPVARLVMIGARTETPQ